MDGLRARFRHNWDALRRAPVAEISGALGDLGTLLPLMTALAIQGSISLTSTLVWSGVFNITTGMVFGIPLPVQPMKAIAAAAIASESSLRETVAAGALVSGAVLFLAATGLLKWLAVHVPVPVVKGIQVGAGLSLVVSAGTSLLAPLGWTVPAWFDNRWWVGVALVGLVATQRSRPDQGTAGQNRFFFVPYALIMFIVGLVLAVAGLLQHHKQLPHPSLWRIRFYLPEFGASDAWSMAIAQLPLTTLNSIVAVSALAVDLFGEGTTDDGGSNSSDHITTSATAFGFSVGLMNLVGCWFGAMPVCHGAGGLAAQYRFGARSGASVVLLGLFKTTVGLVWGSSLSTLLGSFPKSILGVLVLASGLELASVGQSLNKGAPDLWQESSDAIGGRRHRVVTAQEAQQRWTVMLMTTACILAFKNDAVGFTAGLLCHGMYLLRERGADERTALLSRP